MISRRKFTEVTLLSTIAFTGCVTDGSSSDLSIYNETGTVIEGKIIVKSILSDLQTVSDSSMSEDSIMRETFTLQPSESQNDSKEYSEIAGEKETVDIRIDIRDGPKGNHRFTGTNSDSKSVTAYVRTDKIEFVEGQS